jgi:hypothetical protein
MGMLYFFANKGYFSLILASEAIGVIDLEKRGIMYYPAEKLGLVQLTLISLLSAVFKIGFR